MRRDLLAIIHERNEGARLYRSEIFLPPATSLKQGKTHIPKRCKSVTFVPLSEQRRQ
jgi:hypothetical protein